jgi:hypothetical protein
MALHNGAETLFFDNLSLEPFMPYPDQSGSQDNCENFIRNIDKNLARAWKVMKRFCSLINLAAESKRKLSEEILLDTMASVMYRLLHMRFEIGSI